MKVPKVASPNIPRDDFKATAGRSKVLRRFVDERPHDYVLRVEQEQNDGSFALRQLPKGMPIGTSDPEQVPQWEDFGQLLDEETVRVVERLKHGTFIKNCDFVIFQNSPSTEARYRAAGP
jgi:hypothetical protein